MTESHRCITRRPASVFERLAGWSYRRRWWALAMWVVVLAGATTGAQAIGSDYHNDFSLPGTESQRALDTLRRRAPGTARSASPPSHWTARRRRSPLATSVD